MSRRGNGDECGAVEDVQLISPRSSASDAEVEAIFSLPRPMSLELQMALPFRFQASGVWCESETPIRRQRMEGTQPNARYFTS